MQISLTNTIPEPVYPDPESLPLPDDKYEYVLKIPKHRPTVKSDIRKQLKNFKICTGLKSIIATPEEIQAIKQEIADKAAQKDEEDKLQDKKKPGKKKKQEDEDDE